MKRWSGRGRYRFKQGWASACLTYQQEQMQKKKTWPWQSKLNNNEFEKDHHLQYLFSLAFGAASFPSAQDIGSTAEWALLSAPFLPFLSHQAVICYFMVLFFFSLSQQKAIPHRASKPSHKGATALQTWPRCDQLYSNIYINYLAHCLHQGNLLFKTYFLINKSYIYMSHQQARCEILYSLNSKIFDYLFSVS